MASNFEGFRVTVRDENGVLIPVPNQTVKVYDVTGNANLADLTTDSQGIVASGTLTTIAAGSIVRFRVENYLGLATSVSRKTT